MLIHRASLVGWGECPSECGRQKTEARHLLGWQVCYHKQHWNNNKPRLWGVFELAKFDIFPGSLFSTNAIDKKIVCFARPVAAALFPQKVHYEESMVSLGLEFVKVIQGISWILGVRLKVVGGFFCHIDHVVLFTELNVRCCGPWTSQWDTEGQPVPFYMNCIFLLTSLSRFFSSTFTTR